MAYRSVALYRWADHVDDGHVARVADALDELAAHVPGVRALTHGRDVGTVGAVFDYVVVVDVDTLADWRAVRDHPSYILLVEELITGHVAEQSAGQFRVEGRVPATGGDVRDLTDDELMDRARRAAQASMDALLAEPD